MEDRQKQSSDLFSEDDPGMENQRESGQQGEETQEDSRYFSEVSPLRDQETQDEPNAKEQTEEDEMADI